MESKISYFHFQNNNCLKTEKMLDKTRTGGTLKCYIAWCLYRAFGAIFYMNLDFFFPVMNGMVYCNSDLDEGLCLNKDAKKKKTSEKLMCSSHTIKTQRLSSIVIELIRWTNILMQMEIVNCMLNVTNGINFIFMFFSCSFIERVLYKWVCSFYLFILLEIYNVKCNFILKFFVWKCCVYYTYRFILWLIFFMTWFFLCIAEQTKNRNI